MTGIDRNRPKCPGKPLGSTARPAMKTFAIGEMPAPRESAELTANVDFAWIRAGIDAGHAVAIAVTPADDEALKDMIQGRLGFDVVVRQDEPGCVWVCRPGALPWSKVADTTRNRV